MKTIRKQVFAAALLGTSALVIPSLAQAATPAPKFVAADDKNVDLTSGLVFLSMEEGGIGSGSGRVSMQRIWAEGAGFVDNWSGGLYRVTSGGTTKAYVRIAGISDTFTGSGDTWTSDKGDGATLTHSSSTPWVYTARDGTKITFDGNHNSNNTNLNCPGADPTTCQVPLSIVRPDGLRFTLGWTTVVRCSNDLPPINPDCELPLVWRQRLSTVKSSAGYSLAITYASADHNSPDWFKRTGVTFTNDAGAPNPLPAISYAYPNATTIDVTDPGNRTWRFTMDGSGRLTGVRRPGSASNNISYAYGASGGTVSSATVDGVTSTYARSVVGSTATETVTNALSQQTVVISDLTKGRPTSYKDALNRTTSYQYDAKDRLTRTTEPEGNYTQLAYDSRGNVTTATRVAKSGSGLANIVTSAAFDATCGNIVKCNKPNTTTDAKNKVTNYTYNATHGGVLTVTLPAPVTGAVRPKTTYTYSQVQGAATPAASYPPVYMVTKVSACQTLASCNNGADETRVTAGYNSNLLPTTVTRRNGTGTVTSTSTMTYDARGNLDTVNGPLTGTADTTKYKYDSADQLIGAISPDPDGAGTLKNRAVRLTYRQDGQVSKQELGTTIGQTNAAWNAFAPLQTVDITFNTNSRPISAKLSGGATAFALTQTSYDALGRVDCTAVRMNPAQYGSLPASACTLDTQGSFGPDRISKAIYDAAGQVTQNQVAVATADAATERTLTYTNNGMLATLKDAENNLTTYEYDGHDRLSKTRFPLPTKGSNASSTTDYDQRTYDLNSNVVTFRNRAAESTGFTYDNLNRVTLKDLPGTELDVSYAYDNLGRRTSASQTGNALAFTYDALSRNLTQAGPLGTTSFLYDAAGRKTQIVYPAGGTALTINYTYLVTGELSEIKQGSTAISTYAHDDLGNRTGVTFFNGASQGFAYDPVSRLASLGIELSGTADDLAKTYAYNPASQITTESKSNDAYAFSKSNGAETGTANGLNQLTQYAGQALSHDAKGNVTAFGADTFAYSSENLLASATVGGTGTALAYDPLLRLYETSSGGAVARYAYDGLDALAEYDGAGALIRRWVYDPTTRQPVIWYEGTTLSSSVRRYLGADERGSIVSASGDAAASVGINTYDEYGLPAASNIGRPGYTGQAWIPSAQLWYYKARVYHPVLGRFMQPDPIGYAGGMNHYAYVGNDPINLADPLGLDEAVKPKEKEIPTGTRIPGGTSAQLFGSVGGGTVGFPVAVSVQVNTPSTGGICENGTCTPITVTAPSYEWVSLGQFAQVEIRTDPFTGEPYVDYLQDLKEGIPEYIQKLREDHNRCMAQAPGAIDPSTVGQAAGLGETVGGFIGGRAGPIGQGAGRAAGAIVAGGAVAAAQAAEAYAQCMASR